jgi:predicted MFS family arabinose efflux permease
MLGTALSQRLRPRLPGGRPFHLLLLSLAVSSCGDWLYNVALLALVFERTGSPTWVALTTAARVLPVVALGPLGGVLADRHDRRRLIVASDLVRALLMLGLGVVAASGLPILLAPILAAAATAAGTVHPPCVAACTARFVADAELQRANALRSGIGQAAIVAGPALGALVLVAASPAVAIMLNGLTFLASALAVSVIRAGERFAPAERRLGEPGDAGRAPSVLADVLTGARALRGAPTAIRLIAADVLCSAVYGILTVTLVLVGRRVGAGDGGYGLLLGGFGVGGVIGACLTARIDAPARWRRTLAVAMLLVGLPLAALGFVPTLVGAVVLAVLGGGGMIVGEVLCETSLPRMLDDQVLARAYGLVFPISIAGIVLGSLIAGPLVALLGLAGALVAAGATVLIAGALLLSRPLAVGPAPRAALSSAS